MAKKTIPSKIPTTKKKNTLTINLDSIAAKLANLKLSKVNLDGWTNSLVDILEEEYQLETKLLKLIPNS